MSQQPQGAERRRSKRKEVLETFQVFLVIPEKGLRKIYLKDVSMGGLGFVAEANDDFVEQCELDCFFYINPSLKLPLEMKIAHVSEVSDGKQIIGCEFRETKTKAYRAFVAFINLMDDLVGFVESV